ncbi:nuclear pore glycoprotein p62-like isoform X2 [Homarus americanus]|nr:nuclear pore glycoprotein p62-like isoform X2 [Homarus americanus]
MTGADARLIFLLVLAVVAAAKAAPQEAGQTLQTDQDQSQATTLSTEPTSTTTSATTTTTTPPTTTTTPPTTTTTATTTTTTATTATTSPTTTTPSATTATTSATTATTSATTTTTKHYTCRKPGVEYPVGITFEELQEALEMGGVLLIDVRNRTELEATGKLPWSYNLPLPEIYEAVQLDENEFMEKYGFPKPLPEDKNVVLTCRSGRRIRKAGKLLEPLGYCNIRLYFGSFLEWKARGGSIFHVPKSL